MSARLWGASEWFFGLGGLGECNLVADGLLISVERPKMSVICRVPCVEPFVFEWSRARLFRTCRVSGCDIHCFDGGLVLGMTVDGNANYDQVMGRCEK